MKSITSVCCILLIYSHQQEIRTFWSYLKNSLCFLYHLYNYTLVFCFGSFWFGLVSLNIQTPQKLFIFTISNLSPIFSKNLLIAIFFLPHANKHNEHQCPSVKSSNQEVSTSLSNQQPLSKLTISFVLKNFLHLTSWVLQFHDIFNLWPLLFSLFCCFLLIFPVTQFQRPQNSDVEFLLCFYCLHLLFGDFI